MAGLLHQHGHEERDNGDAARSDGVRFCSGRGVRDYRGACREAQSLCLSEAIRRMGPLFHLPALRNDEHELTNQSTLVAEGRERCHVPLPGGNRRVFGIFASVRV